MKLMKVFSLFMVLSFLSLNLFGQSAQTIKLDLEETKERKFNFSQAAHDFNLGADMVILIDNYDEKKDIKITISSIWDKIELKKDHILKSELIDPQTKKNTINFMIRRSKRSKYQSILKDVLKNLRTYSLEFPSKLKYNIRTRMEHINAQFPG
jgi:hypothetical protein